MSRVILERGGFLTIWLQVAILVGLVCVFIGHFPAFCLIDIVQFALDVLEEFVLHRRHPLIPAQKAPMCGNEDIKAQNLPFCDAFGLFDIAERVALEHPAAVGTDLIKFAVLTLNHGATSESGKKKLNSFLLFCIIPYIILGRVVFQRLIETVFGEMNGKTKTPTQGGQQEEAGPLEG
jgi:hypothetical protein